MEVPTGLRSLLERFARMGMMGVEKGRKDDVAIGRPQVSGVRPLGESVIGAPLLCWGT